MASVGEKTTVDHEKTEAHLRFAKKNHLDALQVFWENILWTDETKADVCERLTSCYIEYKTSSVLHKKNFIPKVKHGGGR